MFDRIVVATDGSDSVGRAVDVAVDLAARFDATVHALYVLDTGEVESSPDEVREDLRDALDDHGENALAAVVETGEARDDDLEVATDVREGRPAREVVSYADEIDADLVVTGTRGRHGENRFLIGSVAETVVRTCKVPVLTVRRLTDEDPRRVTF
ncbi:MULTISPECIES: universal stress protein [Haloferacaceae]|uniref:Universal stress protein n=1 Tax=Halorubrum glutamatedens TaxID=2707018 RepID=A0ABD5QRM6_9EURY|nr:universal stress protein [Halobellus captivus]